MRARAIEAFFLHCCLQIKMTARAVKTLEPKSFSLTKIRILALAALTPGLTVGEVVQYLRLTHQSVNGPLKELINDRYIVVKLGEEDRRHKRLFATRKGTQRYIRHVHAQAKNFEGAFRVTGSGAAKTFLEVYRRMVEPSEREWIARALPIAAIDIASD